ncbi:MAG: C40 family peptidase [Oscillospiraceae bacterium]|nr:C40 family peptidase [Oscillospiraceae bacterium]
MKFIRRTLPLLLAVVLMIGPLSISASAAGNTMYGIGFVTASALRLRSEPNTTSEILDTAPRNDCVVVISKEGDWYKVNYNLQEGYMHEDYVSVLTRENAELGYGEVNASRVNLRKGPSTSYGRVDVAAKGDKCYILGLNEGWYKVIYEDSICYIRSDYLSLTEIPYENKESENSPLFFRLGKSTGTAPSASALKGSDKTDETETEESKPEESNPQTPSTETTPEPVTVTGQQILAKAQQYLGTPYVYGGASPAGFDCSGFVYYVLKELGYSPYRTPADQYRQGTYVAKSDLQVGDIVFFAGTYASGISHVGIYAGNGQFIHSPNSRSVVSYSDLTSGYWANHYYGARRMG